jgi:hypothetical protein
MTIQSGTASQVLLSGLSTDTKPVGPNLQNATFLEIDTGKIYQYLGNAWVISNTRAQFADAKGNNLQFVGAPGGYQLPVLPIPTILMSDNFNGTTIDTVNRWQTPVVAGSGTMTQAGGNLVTTCGTTASNAAAITTIESFESNNDFFTPAFSVPVLQPSTLNLPFGFHCINHTVGPAGAPTWSTYAIGVLDGGGTISTVFNGQTLSRARTPNKFININAVSVAAETTIWTPASGKRFRLMGYVLESGTIGGNVILKDNTAGTAILTIPFGAANGVIVSPPQGNGILSVAANNVLTATGTATQTLSGYVFGTEEG